MAFGTQDDADEVMNGRCAGQLLLDEAAIDAQELPRRLTVEAAREPQAELHIRGDRDVRCERVAQAMAAAQQAGIRKIGFITEPRASQAP